MNLLFLRFFDPEIVSFWVFREKVSSFEIF
jgi:hypothetical protein